MSSPSQSPSSSLPSPTSTTSTSTTTTTRRKPRVTPEHTLSRVRENQRRHRARRKDYIATLEEKLAEAEKQLAEARAEIAALRRERDVGVVVLPCKHGGGDAEREGDGDGMKTDSVMGEGVVDDVEDIGEGGDMISLVPAQLQTQMQALDLPTAGADSFLSSFYTLDTIPTPLSTASNLTLAGPPPCCEDKPTTLSPPSLTDPTDPECSTCKTRPLPLPSESTTLCAQAYVMISQQNFRDVDAATIRLWLYQGYRRAQRRGEGCRVENGALFRLLDFISGV